MGLVYAQKKDGVRGKHFYQMGSISFDLMKSCPRELFCAASKMQVKNARKERYTTCWRKEVTPNFDPKKFDPETDFVGSRFDRKDIPLYKTRIVPDYVFFEGEYRRVVKLEKTSSIEFAKVPWYLPTWLGGLGMIPLKEADINKFDRAGSVVIRSHMNERNMKPIAINEVPEWETHLFVQKRLDDFSFMDKQNFKRVAFDGTERELPQDYQKLYNLLLVESFLDSRTHESRLDYPEAIDVMNINSAEGERLYSYGLDHIKRSGKSTRYLFNPNDEEACHDRIMKAVKHNQDIWKIVRLHLKVKANFEYYNSKSHKMKLEDLDPEKKEFSLACFDVRPA